MLFSRSWLTVEGFSDIDLYYPTNLNLTSYEGGVMTTQLFFEDEVSTLKVRSPLTKAVGAHTTYYYLPKAAPKDKWTAAYFASRT